MASEKAGELRALFGVTIQLGNLAEASGEPADTELFLSAALALEARATSLAFGSPAIVPSTEKVDLVCYFRFDTLGGVMWKARLLAGLTAFWRGHRQHDRGVTS